MKRNAMSFLQEQFCYFHLKLVLKISLSFEILTKDEIKSLYHPSIR